MVLRRLKKANGGVMVPEVRRFAPRGDQDDPRLRQMRLHSTIPAMPLLVGSFLAYAWTAGEQVHIAGLIVALTFCGLSLMWVYVFVRVYNDLAATDPQAYLLEHAGVLSRCQSGKSLLM